MRYKKPDNIRYVDMEIYIDTKIPSGEYDETTVYNYLYCLSCMVAMKKKLCRGDLVDDFGNYCASSYFRRLLYPERTDTPIKTIYNYINKTIYMRWQRFCSEMRVADKDNTDDLPFVNDWVVSSIESSLDCYAKSRFKFAMDDIPKTIAAFMQRLPYKPETTLWRSINVSCMLSLLSLLSIDQYSKRYIYCQKPSHTDNALYNYYSTHRKNFVILYHLPSSYYGYIQVLTLQLLDLIAQELVDTYNDTVAIDSSVLSIYRQEMIYNEDDD